MVDIEKTIKTTVKQGKVIIGAKQTKQTVDKGSAKLVVLSNNCPLSEEIKKISEKKKIPVYNSKFNSIELGYSCGKNFAVSAFTVLDDGGSNILKLVKKS